jgi:hypothetical protein
VGEGSVGAVFIVLLTSYAIASRAAPASRESPVEQHLFGGNTPLLGLSSSVGAIVSMAVAFTALLSVGFVFGWQVLLSIGAGGAAGLKALATFARRQRTRNALDDAATQNYRYGASYLAILATGRSNGFLLFYAVAILFYQAMLATELAVLRKFLHFFIPMPSLELGLLLAIIVIVCYSYVFLGGFRGVLTTDYFQLLVVVAFIALVAAHLVHASAPPHIPSMATAATTWTPIRLVLLHVGVFIGAFGWAFGNIDQWYRTIGTLPLNAALRTLKFAAVITYTIAIAPVLAGSAAIAHLPRAVGNTASLHLLNQLWMAGDSTLRFVLVMALTCAALTTLNTYTISTEQLYYEMSIRMIATSHRQYFFEWLLKWKQIRVAALVALALAYGASFAISDTMVYAVGVCALCGFIFFVPALLVATKHAADTYPRSDVATLATSLVLTPIALIIGRHYVGEIATQLYLLPAAIGIACAVAVLANQAIKIVRTRWNVSKSS